MRLSKSNLAVAMASFLTLLAPRVTPDVVCPESYLQAQSSTPSYSSAARRELIASSLFSSADARYDLVARTIGASVVASTEHSAQAEVGALVECTVTAPDGTPVSFAARMHVTGYSSMPGQFSYGSASALLREDGTSNEANVSVPLGSALDQYISIALQQNGGQPFRLFMRGSASTLAGSAAVNGVLSFDNLPPGATITICLGDTVPQVVPAQRTSWGAVKTRYR